MFKWLRKKKKEELPSVGNINEEFEERDFRGNDIEVLNSKLDLINVKLDAIKQKLELLEK